MTNMAHAHDRLMNRVYRHQRHIYDLTRKYYLFGRDRLIAELEPGPEDAVLEIGCGTARNLIKAAVRFPKTRCFGIDISEEMLNTASTSIARHGVGDRIRLKKADAAYMDGAALFGQPQFERIFLSYCLSMIPAWPAALASAMRALAPGGRLAIVDFGELADWPRLISGAMLTWLDRFHVTPRPDLVAVTRELADGFGFQMTSTQVYGGYAQTITVIRPARASFMPADAPIERAGPPTPRAASPSIGAER